MQCNCCYSELRITKQNESIFVKKPPCHVKCCQHICDDVKNSENDFITEPENRWRKIDVPSNSNRQKRVKWVTDRLVNCDESYGVCNVEEHVPEENKVFFQVDESQNRKSPGKNQYYTANQSQPLSNKWDRCYNIANDELRRIFENHYQRQHKKRKEWNERADLETGTDVSKMSAKSWCPQCEQKRKLLRSRLNRYFELTKCNETEPDSTSSISRKRSKVPEDHRLNAEDEPNANLSDSIVRNRGKDCTIHSSSTVHCQNVARRGKWDVSFDDSNFIRSQVNIHKNSNQNAAQEKPMWEVEWDNRNFILSQINRHPNLHKNITPENAKWEIDFDNKNYIKSQIPYTQLWKEIDLEDEVEEFYPPETDHFDPHLVVNECSHHKHINKMPICHRYQHICNCHGKSVQYLKQFCPQCDHVTNNQEMLPGEFYEHDDSEQPTEKDDKNISSHFRHFSTPNQKSSLPKNLQLRKSFPQNSRKSSATTRKYSENIDILDTKSLLPNATNYDTENLKDSSMFPCESSEEERSSSILFENLKNGMQSSNFEENYTLHPITVDYEENEEEPQIMRNEFFITRKPQISSHRRSEKSSVPFQGQNQIHIHKNVKTDDNCTYNMMTKSENVIENANDRARVKSIVEYIVDKISQTFYRNDPEKICSANRTDRSHTILGDGQRPLANDTPKVTFSQTPLNTDYAD